MPDNTGGQGSVDARELWKQWSGTTTQMWEIILGGMKAPYSDPYGLYQAWFRTMSDMQEQMMEQAKASSASASQATEVWRQWLDSTTQFWSNTANAFKEVYTSRQSMYQAWLKTMNALQKQMKGASLAVPDAQEAWNLWFEYATEAWLKVASAGADPLGLTAQWLKMLEETRAKLQAIGTFPTDPFTLYKQWYDATSETWAKAAEQLIGTEQFIEAARRFTDNYASYSLAMRRANEAYFHNLQLPTRSDIARVASLVIALEDKVDKLEDAFEDNSARTPSQQAAAVRHIDAHLRTVEGKVEALQVAVAQIDTAATLAHLDQRLTQVENKLDQFLHLLEKIEGRVGTDKVSEARRKSVKTVTDIATSNGFVAETISPEPM